MEEQYCDNHMSCSRSQKKLLRVTFSDGTVFCYKNATMTFTESLRKIGVNNLQNVKLEMGHLPMFSKEVYPKFKDYMKPLDDGWYVNVQSDSSQKYLQLIAIKNALGLDFTVELGANLETSSIRAFSKTKTKTDCLLIKFPDGTFSGGSSPKESYIEGIRRIGFELLYRKEFDVFGKEIITRHKKYTNQIQVDDSFWLTIPGQTKEKVKVFEAIKSRLKICVEVQII